MASMIYQAQGNMSMCGTALIFATDLDTERLKMSTRMYDPRAISCYMERPPVVFECSNHTLDGR
jgi:hypothetical protein